MTRIFLPLAAIAAILLAPIFSFESNNPITGADVTQESGYSLVGDTVQCFLNQNFSTEGDCAPKGEMRGLAIFYAVLAAAVAAALGVLGLLPFVGRLTSVATTIAGVVIIGGLGYFCMNTMGQEGVGIEWGAYLAAGLGLLTLISGLSGMRGQ